MNLDTIYCDQRN